MYCQHCGKFTENTDGVCETCRDTLETAAKQAGESQGLAENTQNLTITGEEKQEEKDIFEVSAGPEFSFDSSESAAEKNAKEKLENKEGEQGKESASLMKKIPKLEADKWNNYLKQIGKEMISMQAIKESAFLIVLTLCISAIVSLFTSVIANLLLKSQIDSIWGQAVGGFVNDSEGGFLTFYRLLRMSYLHTIKLTISAMGKSAVLHVNVRLLILTLIPFVSMLISWKLLCNQKIRSSLKFLFSEEPIFKSKKVMPVTFNFSIVLTVLFFLTSFIPVDTAKSGYYAIKLSYGAIGSIFGTLSITLLSCYIITGILKLREKKNLPSGSNLWNLKYFYKRYGIGVITVSLLIVLIAIIRGDMWKQLGTVLLSLPNVFVILANALSFGGLQIIDAGNVSSLRSSLGGFQLACAVVLALAWCIFLWYLFYQTYLKLEKSNKMNYLKKAGIFSGIILIIQLVFYSMSKVAISASMLGETELGIGIKVNILLSLLVLVLVSAGAAACAYYFPDLLHKKGSKEEVFLVGTWKRLDRAVLIVLSILTLLTVLGMTKKQSGTVTSGSFTGKEEYSAEESYSMIEPENIKVFSGGFVFNDYSQMYTYQKGKVKRIHFDEGVNSYFGDSDYYFSKTSEYVLKVGRNKAMLVDNKGKELYKQEVSFDKLLCAANEFDKLVFLVDGDVTLYHKKDNNFTILEGITDYEYTDFYFDDSEESLYLVDNTIRRYDLKSKKLEVVKEQVPEYIVSSKEDLTAKLYLVEGGKLVPPVGDTNIKYYVKNTIRDYESYSVIMENGKESPASLPDMVSAEAIDKEGTKFLVTFTEYGDYYLYDATKAELTNLSTQIRYLTSNGKIEGES